MRLIDADELMEHVWRDKLDSRELIAEMIEKAPTISTTEEEEKKIIQNRQRSDDMALGCILLGVIIGIPLGILFNEKIHSEE